jgi:hypothetical protein
MQMKKFSPMIMILGILLLVFTLVACGNQDEAPAPAAQGGDSQPAVISTPVEPVIIEVERNVGDMSVETFSLAVSRGMTEEGRACVDCHRLEQPGIINDWKDSRHAHAGVSCIDCHGVEVDDPTATQHEDLIGTDTYISVLVPPSVCARCHPAEVSQFNASGHFRSYRQIIPKDSLHALVQKHEGQSHPEFGNAPGETGCMQCHGTEFILDDENRPIDSTWPNMGMGNIYPDGSTGNCAT